MMTLGKQLNILAEKTYDLKKNMSEKDKQRRNQVVDLYGVDFYRESHLTSDGEHLASIWVSISPDLVYYERFQFKLYIANTEATDFKVKVRTDVKNDDGSYDKDKKIDITPYLIAQENGAWITGASEYPYPTDDVGEEPDPSKPAKSYDMLEVISDMYAEGKDNYATALERPEFKRFQIVADKPFSVALILYLKYSHLNR